MKKKSLVLGVAGALAVAGGSAGIAATRGDSPREESQAIIDDAAKQLGVSSRALSDALKTALKNRVDAAVAAGRLTKEQGNELKARIDASGAPLVFGGLRHGALGHFLHLDAAASYLGLSDAELRNELSAGKTLAQVAKDHGKSVDGLVAAMTAAATSRLDDAVAAGRLTQAEANAVRDDLKHRITDLVNGQAPSFHDGFRLHRFGSPFFGGHLF
jgi:polyhydroxyalkanoate synthesis regulator phasin